MSEGDSPGRIPKAEALPGSTDETIVIEPLAVNEHPFDRVSFDGFERSVSVERFDSYLRSAGGDRNGALRLYALNSAVSTVLFPTFQNLEIAIRNAFHHSLSDRYGEWWFDQLGVITDVFQRQKIADAQIQLVKEGKPLTPGRVVASLAFGFWTSCLGARYEDTLWRRGGLSAAFAAVGAKPKRNTVNRQLTPIRLLRNRIAHHEPILHLNLPKHRQSALDLTEACAPALAEWTKEHCAFDETYDPDLARTFMTPGAEPKPA